jgi:hypothetical protein
VQCQTSMQCRSRSFHADLCVCFRVYENVKVLSGIVCVARQQSGRMMYEVRASTACIYLRRLDYWTCWLARWSLNPTTFQRRSRALNPGKLMLKFAKIAQANPSLALPPSYMQKRCARVSLLLQPKELRKPRLSAWRLGLFLFSARC